VWTVDLFRFVGELFKINFVSLVFVGDGDCDASKIQYN
jgi:hypothetical protein